MGRSIFASRGASFLAPNLTYARTMSRHGLVAEGAKGRGALARSGRAGEPRAADRRKLLLPTGDRRPQHRLLRRHRRVPDVGRVSPAADTLVHMCCFFDEEIARLGMEASVSGPGLAGKVAAVPRVRNWC